MTSSQATFNPEGQIIAPQTPPERVITLPGQGTPGPDCQDDVYMHCNHCGHTWIGQRSCMLRDCPHCWRKWAAKEARSAGLRMWAGTCLIAPKRTGRRLLHCVVSFVSSGDYTADRSRAHKLAKKHGISGGLVLFHPFRQDDDGEYIPQSHIHYHIIGLARGAISPGTSGDYFFKVIRDAERKDFRGFSGPVGIKACIFYLLTHCGIIQGRHSLTWFGELSYNSLSNEKLYNAIPELKREMEKEPIKRCPACGSEDVEPDWIYDWTQGDMIDCRPAG